MSGLRTFRRRQLADLHLCQRVTLWSLEYRKVSLVSRVEECGGWSVGREAASMSRLTSRSGNDGTALPLPSKLPFRRQQSPRLGCRTRRSILGPDRERVDDVFARLPGQFA